VGSGQTRQEACDRLETTVMRPSGTRENKQTNKQGNCKRAWSYVCERAGKVSARGSSEARRGSSESAREKKWGGKFEKCKDVNGHKQRRYSPEWN
jgi:hypothetical protein